MPSLRKRVSSYFRQLSFHNEPREKRTNINENSFVTKYLQGQVALKDGPPIIHGKNPTDLPNYDLANYKTGADTIIGCYTGPNGGLTTIKRKEKHLSVLDPDIDFIDTPDEVEIEKPPPKSVEHSPNKNTPIDITSMQIKVAGQTYHVTNLRKKRHSKSHSLGTLSDFNIIEFEKTKIDRNSSYYNNNNNNEPIEVITDLSTISTGEGANVAETGEIFDLAKSKSEGNPFRHRKEGKIIRIAQRPTASDDTSNPSNNTGKPGNTRIDPSLPVDWTKTSDHVFGMSDSLYDRNLVTKRKNGDPIADCFGIVARRDSAVLAVADGVNWGEKACIAAKSAIHASLHYLNSTIFLDSTPFDSLVITDSSSSPTTVSSTPSHDTPTILTTRDVFVCLLRAFHCAHDLILETGGMLTTLTVAVVVPVRGRSGTRERGGGGGGGDKYVCCVCNVGDTLAYVYSQEYGVRELTKGSHDINCNRDMRDALGALGPVDGINPELSNLTLSITTVQKGDIILIASDGLTDNFDPNVCKFTVSGNSSTEPVVKPARRNATPPRKIVETKSAASERNVETKSGSEKIGETKSGSEKIGETKSGSEKIGETKSGSEKIGETKSGSEKIVEQKSDKSERLQKVQESVGETKDSVTVRLESVQKCLEDHQNKCKKQVTLAGSEKANSVKTETPTKPPRKNFVNKNRDSVAASRASRESSLSSSTIPDSNPLIAQFLRENSPVVESSEQKQTNPVQKSSSMRVVVVPPKPSTSSVQKSTSMRHVVPPPPKPIKNHPPKYNFLRSKTLIDFRHPSHQKTPTTVKQLAPVARNPDGIPYVTPVQRYELTLLLMEDILRRGITGSERQCVTARRLCENLLSFTVSITSAKRKTLEDSDLYYDQSSAGILVELSGHEKKSRRKRALEKVQHLPGKLDHVTVVGCNVGLC